MDGKRRGVAILEWKYKVRHWPESWRAVRSFLQNLWSGNEWFGVCLTRIGRGFCQRGCFRSFHEGDAFRGDGAD